jgi:hypothetical protein
MGISTNNFHWQKFFRVKMLRFNKQKGFTPTPILKKAGEFLTYRSFLSLFKHKKEKSVGIGVSLQSKRGFTPTPNLALLLCVF